MFRVARKIRIGRETENTHIFFLALLLSPSESSRASDEVGIPAVEV